MYSGHKASEAGEIVASRGIKPREQKTPVETMRSIEAGFSAYSEQLLRETEEAGGDRDEALKKIDADKPLYLDAYREAHRSPVETREVLGPLLLAMQQGRPFILDELNAIPHHTLIIMNDLLMRRPGDTVKAPIPEATPFKVEKGFCVIATGNYKPEDGLSYIGRQPLDSAFLSRFAVVSYDYLPVPLPDDVKEKAPKNELFDMLVVRLMEKNGSIRAPENAFEQLKELSEIARRIQNIFSEKKSGIDIKNERGVTIDKPKDIIKENVLSLRHLIPIIERWKAEDYKWPLENYIFLDYVSRSDARPLEKFNLYRIFKLHSNFFKGSEWPDSLVYNDELLNYPIEKTMFGAGSDTHESKEKIKTYSLQDVVDEVSGPFIEVKSDVTPGEKKSSRVTMPKAAAELLTKAPKPEVSIETKMAGERSANDVAKAGKGNEDLFED
jgi:hypothetical protein